MVSQSTSTQKKIYMAATIIAVALAAFWFLLYLPKEKELKALVAQFKNLRNQIQKIETIVAARNESQLKRTARKEFRFAEKEKEGWGMLSDLAARYDLKTSSIRSEPKVPFVDENMQKIDIDGKICQKIKVVIEMKGQYKDLIRYLAKLKEALSTYVTIERLQIRPDDPQEKTLNISLDLYLYFLS